MEHECWSCGATIDTEEERTCKKCHWFICPECEECGCGYYTQVEDRESYRASKGVYGVDYDYEDE